MSHDYLNIRMHFFPLAAPCLGSNMGTAPTHKINIIFILINHCYKYNMAGG
jgi:hypothetical protein